MQGLKFTVGVLKDSSHLKMVGKGTITWLAGKKKRISTAGFFCLAVWAANSEDVRLFCRKACAFLCQHGRAAHAPPEARPGILASEEEICVCGEPATKEPCPISSRASLTPELERTGGGGGGGVSKPLAAVTHMNMKGTSERKTPTTTTSCSPSGWAEQVLAALPRKALPDPMPSPPGFPGKVISHPAQCCQPLSLCQCQGIPVRSVMGCRQPLPLVLQQDV